MTQPRDSAAVDVVLLQHWEATKGRAARSSTSDLSLHEVRDAVWLATRLVETADRAARPAPPDPSAPDAVADPAPQEQPPRSEEAATEPDDPADPGVPETLPEPRAQRDWARGPLSLPPADPAPDRADGAPTAAAGWPTLPGLPDRHGISRALRPLARHRSPSPWRVVVDEEKTAVRAAQDSLWIPECRPAPWHRFEVALVVDTVVAPDIWEPTVTEFRSLLDHQGAFRNIRTYRLDSAHADPDRLTLRSEGGARHHWRHLVEPTGNRIVLVLTDTVAEGWHTGAVGHVLHEYGIRAPVAVVQTLAHRLWQLGGLPTRRMRLSAPRPGCPNRALRVAGKTDSDVIPVPVLGLAEDWMAGWARLLTSPGAEWVETTAALVGPQTEIPPSELPDDEPVTAAQRVRRFRSYASTDAVELAGLLAATPLAPRLMTLVQRVLLPGADLSVLAEVMLGGLLTKLPGDGRDPSAVAYDFHDDVRSELLAIGRRGSTARVARVLDDYAGSAIPALRAYRAAVDDPTIDTPEATPDSTPFLLVQEAVLRALSGPYLPRSKRLREALGLATPVVPGGSRPAGSSANRENNDLTTTEPRSPVDETAQPSGGEETMTAPGITTDPVPERRPAALQPQIWGQIPLRNPIFVGREQLLEDLRTRLSESGTTAVLPEALHGLGGVGKSQTVVEYLYRHSAEYDVVWWIPAEHPAQIRNSFVELAKKLGVAGSGTAEAAVPAVREALRKGVPHQRWVLVFDNADRPQDVRQFFPAGAGHIIVTSRNSAWEGFARPVEVDLFTRHESIELLRRRGGGIEDTEADALAEALGDLPLAVEQAAAWRAQTGMQVAEYLDLLEQNRTELLEADPQATDQLPVAAAWNVPLNKLATEQPAALQLLQVCAFFGPEPISQKLFRGARDVPVPEALAQAFGDPIKISRAVKEITRYSLAKIDHRNNALQLHRLVQTVLKNKLSPSEQDEMRHAVHVLLVNGDPGDPDAAANWPRYAELLPHALVSRAVESKDKWVRVLVINLVRYLLRIGDFGAARDLAGQAKECWTEALGERDRDTLEISRRYAIALRRLGFVSEARTLNERTRELVREVVGEEDEQYLGMLDTVAADYRSEGRFAEELRLQQEVYERAGAILGADDPGTLNYGFNLAGCYRIMGQYEQARELDQAIMRRRGAVLGANHLQTFGSRNAYCMDLRECGQYLEAARQQEDSLNYLLEVAGPDNPQSIGATRNLSVALRKAGFHDRANEYSGDCLARYRRRHGDDHADTITAEMNVSTDLRHLGELEEALKLARGSHERFQALMTPGHLFTLVAALNLAVILRLHGEPDEALALDRQTHAALLDLFGGDHPTTLIAATNLASDLAAKGEHAEARSLDVATKARSERVLGPDHPSTLAVALNLALDLAALGEDDEAALLHSKTVQSLRTVLGDNHPAVVAATQHVRANCDSDTMQL
ncbi:FxSxx-COOH system tetratricopeptide repeat protein [Actinosynnema sp. NPDC047251]|uniref:NB-ARC domain protein n=1 Tax=Saccharothrix espanaensis (strain ATCC 51144 / DSM 44229 / JCM 9112 / NBRC 15066 / NRRL 15764) TaxID=1179773 RepID=K0K9A3_SACES|nr:FxSxx-COOH system tetratricopeptide repeat protein [Saccharothrix espanaensis]CCH33419.1 NB-ARC domain protein [Saccharothrix espanaensis DSM 44229]